VRRAGGRRLSSGRLAPWRSRFFGLSDAERICIGDLPGHWYSAVGRFAVRVEFNRERGWFARVYRIDPPAMSLYRNVVGFYQTPTLAAEAGRLAAQPRDDDAGYISSPQDIDDVRRSRWKAVAHG
jgi:hypothetical protein